MTTTSSSQVHSTNQEKRNKLDVNILTPDEILAEVAEVRIKMPFGHIAGKWWGPKDIQPILALHGWQDNAGTFDRLIPLLPKKISVLALDLPGHGLSSKIPNGVNYNFLNNLTFLMTLIKIYKWKKIDILGHSMGAVNSFIFAAVFPGYVNSVIAIDAMKPSVYDPAIVPDLLQENVMKFLIADQRNREESEPPLYDYDGLVEKLNAGTNEWVSRETCHYLLKRAVRESTIHPDKYYFGRDSRLKFNVGVYLPQEVQLVLAQRIVDHKIPYLYIKADQTSHFDSERNFLPVYNIMKTNPNFEHRDVSGTHHVHLTDPAQVAPLVTDFIIRHKNRSKL